MSRISRDRTVAYARKQKPTDESGDSTDDDDAAKPDEAAAAPNAPAPTAPAATAPDAPADAAPAAPADAPTAPAAAAPAAIDPPVPNVQPWPDATPLPAPAPSPVRARTETVAMPAQASIGAPPAMPVDAPPVVAPPTSGAAEAPTHMPGPRDIPGGNPDDPAAPPGVVPPGDSRSMRHAARREFALVYRIQTFVISRFGVVGTRGQWRVVEYPTSASASHAYAKEVSRFVSDGFSDYRE